MRIGMILDKTFPPDPRVENEAIELIKAGHKVFLFCLKYDNTPNQEVINGINVIRYNSNVIEYKLSALTYSIPLYTFLMKRKVKQFLTSFKIEAIHVHDMVIAEAVFSIKKNKLPIILDLHENRPEIMKFYPHLKKGVSKYLISIQKWKQKETNFINKADKLILVTQEAKDEVLLRCTIKADNVIVVPNTVRKSFYENFYGNKKTGDFNLLYIGDTGERRGLKTVVKSLLLLKQDIENIKFTVVGAVNNELKDLVEKNQLEDYVDFKGWQNESEFQKFINESDVCLSPLHRNKHHDTTYANKIFQYMSLAKPVLVSNATAQEQLVKKHNTGLVHVEKDVVDFTEKVIKLYNDKALRNELGTNGKEFVHNYFTWDVTAKKLIQLYNELS